MLTRFPDWPSRLEQAIAVNRGRHFCHGRWDCCLAVADLVLAMTGTDIASEYRGQYCSRKEAVALAVAHTGTKSLSRFLTQALVHLPSIPVLCAQRGDIVLVQRPSDVSLGIISLSGKDILAVSKEGFCHFPLRLAIQAWHV